MPLQDIRDRTAAALAGALESELGHRPDDVFLEVPPRRDLGDLAWPGALPLAKVLRRPPREIADSLAQNARWPEEIERVEVAGPGFLNFFLSRDTMLIRSLQAKRDEGPECGSRRHPGQLSARSRASGGDSKLHRRHRCPGRRRGGWDAVSARDRACRGARRGNLPP